MKKNNIRIFLSCSEELKAERSAFREFISVENDRLNEKGIYLKLEQWEYTLSAITTNGTQENYNIEAKNSDIIVCLFYTKIGPFTQQEFDASLKQFSQTGNPLIYTYFKILGPNDKEDKSLVEFRKRLTNDLKHFYNRYDSFADLQNQFRHQLDLMEAKGIIQFQEDKQQTTQEEISQYVKKYKLRALLRMLGITFIIVLSAFITAKVLQYFEGLKPFNLKVRIENQTISPELPEPVAQLLLTYGLKTEPKDSVRGEETFESIPGQFRNENLRLQFMAAGFLRIDTMVPANGKLVLLPVRRNNDLAMLSGAIMNTTGQPLEGVRVSIDCCTTYTDSAGKFKLVIPLEHQQEQQRLSLYKDAYAPINITTPVLPGEMVRQILHRN